MGNRSVVEVCCACCGEIGPHGGRGLRRSCYQQHLRAKTLGQFPKSHGYRPRLGRMVDFAELRARGKTVRAAAKQLGVHPRTGTRYSTALKTSSERHSHG